MGEVAYIQGHATAESSMIERTKVGQSSVDGTFVDVVLATGKKLIPHIANRGNNSIVIYSTVNDNEVAAVQGDMPGNYVSLDMASRMMDNIGIDPDTHSAVLIPEKVRNAKLFKKTHKINKKGEFSKKPINPVTLDKTEVIADGVDFITLTNVPDSCELKIENDVYVITGGTETLTFDVPGSYKLKFDHPDFTDYEVRINAN